MYLCTKFDENNLRLKTFSSKLHALNAENITDKQNDKEGWKITISPSMYSNHVHGGAHKKQVSNKLWINEK